MYTDANLYRLCSAFDGNDQDQHINLCTQALSALVDASTIEQYCSIVTHLLSKVLQSLQSDPPAIDTAEYEALQQLPLALMNWRDKGAHEPLFSVVGTITRASTETRHIWQQHLEAQDEAIAAFREHLSDGISTEDICHELELIATGLTSYGNVPLANLHHQLRQLIQAAHQSIDTDLLAKWFEHVSSYLSDKAMAGAVVEQYTLLLAATGGQALDDEQSQHLLTQLVAAPWLLPSMTTERSDQQPLSQDCVSIVPSENVSDAVIASFCQEISDHASTLQQQIISIVGAARIDDITVAQRVAHNLKGAARTAGISAVATLCESLEDVFEYLVQYQSIPNPTLNELLTAASDSLQEMTDHISRRDYRVNPAITDNWFTIITSLNTALAERSNYLPMDDAEDDPVNDADAEQDGANPQSRHDASVAAVSTTLALDLNSWNKLQIAVDGVIDGNSRLDNILLTENLLLSDLQHCIDRIQRCFVGLHQLRPLGHPERSMRSDFASKRLQLLEALADGRTLLRQFWGGRGRVEGLLMDQYRMQEALRDRLWRIRLISISTIRPKLEATVRQASRLAQKTIALSIVGDEVEVDGEILICLYDCLGHLIRNAIDHGIESPEVREQLGKSKTGSINICFIRKGNMICIQCCDDGSGLDHAAIEQQARDQGLWTDTTTPDEHQLSRLVVTPGFSTKPSSVLSGRGIGLDAAATMMQKVNGQLSINSQSGQGLRVELQVPIMGQSSHALLADTGDSTVAISMVGISRLLSVQQIHYDADNHLLSGTGMSPSAAISLNELLCCPLTAFGDTVTLIQVRTTLGDEWSVLVDRISDLQHVVVRTLNHYVPQVHGVQGATTLGNGHLVLVVSLPTLLARYQQQVSPRQQDNIAAPAHHEEPYVLIADDSPTIRISMTEMVQGGNYCVKSAKDGQEALSIIESSSQLPLAIITNYEMPNMNGFELTRAVRDRADTATVPIILISTRSSDSRIRPMR